MRVTTIMIGVQDLARSKRFYGEGLGADATPFDILASSSGDRATDSIRVHPGPVIDPVSGQTICRFLAHGVRHIAGASERIARLKIGDKLLLRPEPGNEVNSQALLLDVASDQPVGYVPNLLLDYVHAVQAHRGADVRVHHVNPTHTPAALRLVCRLEGFWPPGDRPITGDDYEPIS